MIPLNLEKIGLTRNENIVYLTLLELGTSKTGEILKKSGLNSGKIYEILDGLKKKGLVSESVVNNVKHFTAAPPSQLLEYVETKKSEIKKEELEVRSLLPNLERLRNVVMKDVKAVVYTGLRGIKTAADEALDSMKPGQDMVAMGITSLKDQKFNEFWKQWSQKRIQKRIFARHIISESGDYYEYFRKLKCTEARVLIGITPVAVDIFGDDKVLILNYKEPASCILIYDVNTTTSFRQFFEQLWKIANS